MTKMAVADGRCAANQLNPFSRYDEHRFVTDRRTPGYSIYRAMHMRCT